MHLQTCKGLSDVGKSDEQALVFKEAQMLSEDLVHSDEAKSVSFQRDILQTLYLQNEKDRKEMECMQEKIQSVQTKIYDLDFWMNCYIFLFFLMIMAVLTFTGVEYVGGWSNAQHLIKKFAEKNISLW